MTDTSRYASSKIVVGKNQSRDRRVPHVLGDPKPEPVMVQEYSVQLFIEELPRDLAFELVVAEIQELKGR